jgi:hypothetical protein
MSSAPQGPYRVETDQDVVRLIGPSGDVVVEMLAVQGALMNGFCDMHNAGYAEGQRSVIDVLRDYHKAVQKHIFDPQSNVRRDAYNARLAEVDELLSQHPIPPTP